MGTPTAVGFDVWEQKKHIGISFDVDGQVVFVRLTEQMAAAMAQRVDALCRSRFERRNAERDFLAACEDQGLDVPENEEKH